MIAKTHAQCKTRPCQRNALTKQHMSCREHVKNNVSFEIVKVHVQTLDQDWQSGMFEQISVLVSKNKRVLGHTANVLWQ